MAKRVLTLDGDDQSHFFLLLQAGALSVGTDPEAGGLVLQDVRVRHIRCEVEIEDGPVVVHGDPAAPAGRELHGSEAMPVAAAKLRVSLTGEAAPEPVAVVAARVAPAAEMRAPAAAAATAAPAAVSPAIAPQPVLARRLLVIDGADQGRSYPVPTSGRILIGRTPRVADIVLHDLYVSRVHSQLQIDGERVVVTHVEGPGGTIINGKKVTEQELRLGDILRIGNSHLRFELGQAEVRTETESADDVGTYTGSPALGVPAASPRNGPPASPTGPATAEAPTDALIKLEGQVLSHFQFGALLGRGQTGLIFRAHHRQSNQPVAVKVLAPDFPSSDAEQQTFVRTLKAITPLRHPHLVTLHGGGRTGPYCWIAREFVEGENLAAAVARNQIEGQPSWKLACRVAVHLGRLLDFLEQRRVPCTKITPTNVLVQNETRVTKLADLLLDQALQGSRLRALNWQRQRVAELPYRAPEQTEPSLAIDHRASLYGLGAVLYYVLLGRPPFSANSGHDLIAAIRSAELVRPTKVLRDIPPPFEAAILRLLARRPDDRFPSAAEMLTVVEPIANMHEIPV